MLNNSGVTAYKADISKISQVTGSIGACKTQAEVQAIADSLAPEDRWMTTCLTPEHYCAFFRDESGTPKQYNGVSGSNSITISYSRISEDAQQDDADNAYEALFNLISSGLKEAVKQNKRLVVFVGEAHSNRGSLMLDLMAADIAKHLGITDIGIENEEHAVTIKTLDGRTVERPSLAGWGEHASAILQNGRFPETHDLCLPPDKRTANRAVFIPHLFRAEENHIFPTDCYPGDASSIIEILDERDAFQAKRIVEESNGRHVMHFGGSSHLYGLEKNMKTHHAEDTAPDSYYIGIRTEQEAYLTPEFMSATDDLVIERYTAPCIQRILVNGRVHTIEQARKLAEGAEKALGEKLANKFFRDNPELAPELESMQAGGRVKDAQGWQRSA